MPYLIDGHNLIPKIPGLSLKDIDDEMELLKVVQEFCRKQRKRAEVFFDNAPPGNARTRSLGLVTARFVRQGKTADTAIRERLEQLGREARNWSVVSSDLAVQASARAAQAGIISSENFARAMLQTLEQELGDQGANPNVALSEDELDDWLDLFGSKR